MDEKVNCKIVITMIKCDMWVQFEGSVRYLPCSPSQNVEFKEETMSPFGSPISLRSAGVFCLLFHLTPFSFESNSHCVLGPVFV